ncbi:formate/nitrite transporter family protein [Lentisphaerota bacterium WC36G]|nr:formate/nitrite transporter family protein [Lentisphaerae bacterium WC36]
MVLETIENFSNMAVKKIKFLNLDIAKYFLMAILASIYVGFAVILIINIGAPLHAAHNPFLKTLIGLAFGLALTLVIFAGAELFTSNNMIMTIGVLDKRIKFMNLVKLWTVCYIGNFVGGIILAFTIKASGLIKGETAAFTEYLASYKAASPFFSLMVKGILCNILVCLAVWTCARTKNDMAKLALIFWCLFAFISSGFEHSVANMTLFPLAILTTEKITIMHLVHNIIPASIGNIIGGALLGACYYFIAKEKNKLEV